MEIGSVLRERPVDRPVDRPVERPLRRPDAGGYCARDADDDAAGDAPDPICGASAAKVGRWNECLAPLNGLASGTPYISLSCACSEEPRFCSASRVCIHASTVRVPRVCHTVVGQF